MSCERTLGIWRRASSGSRSLISSATYARGVGVSQVGLGRRAARARTVLEDGGLGRLSRLAAPAHEFCTHGGSSAAVSEVSRQMRAGARGARRTEDGRGRQLAVLDVVGVAAGQKHGQQVRHSLDCACLDERLLQVGVLQVAWQLEHGLREVEGGVPTRAHGRVMSGARHSPRAAPGAHAPFRSVCAGVPHTHSRASEGARRTGLPPRSRGQCATPTG